MFEQDLSDCSKPFCPRPVALQFAGHTQRRDRLRSRGHETADGLPVTVSGPAFQAPA
jgi:hypothetical protein